MGLRGPGVLLYPGSMMIRSFLPVFLSAVLPAAAELPILAHRDLHGYYAIHETQRYVFAMECDGTIQIIPRKRDKEWVAVANRIRLEYGIEELQPEGKVVFKQTRFGSLESEHEATDDIDRLVIRGVATGDAVYELVIEQSRDVFSIGGRVVDPGGLTEHPVRFVLRVSLPNVYRRTQAGDRDGQREFEKLTRRDYIELIRLDGSRQQLTHDDNQPLDGEALSGAGLESIEMRVSYYEGRRFFFAATKESGMMIGEDRSPGAWYEGMMLIWTTDPTKDPGGEGRLSFWVK